MKTIKTLTLIAASIISLGAVAADTADIKVNGPADPALIAVIHKLKALYPATQIKEVSGTPLPGIYQVLMGRNVAFVDESGRYFLFGHLYDMKDQRDLTMDSSATVAKTDFAALPLADAIVTVKGSGTRKVAVFMDPDCPYCRQLESALDKLTDATIYTFLMPLEGLHPDAKRKSVGVWCAKDRAKAWNDLMTRNVVTDGSCDAPIDRNIKLAERLGITGTPTLIFANGQVMPGAPRTDQLEQLLGAK
jgi:thiol:disulfide interchange protein DsbC